MTEARRSVYFISDRTGITAEALGHSLLTQFSIDFEQRTIPFVDTEEKAAQVVEQLNAASQRSGLRPIVFSTVVDAEVRRVLQTTDAVLFDFFDTFIAPLEQELRMPSSHVIGRSHGVVDNNMYDVRIDAMNYALNHDDGAVTHHYSRADVILTAVSRSGKTPTCIYLALQYGIYAANYPLTQDDLNRGKLPRKLVKHKRKLYGLTINVDRLQKIRSGRLPNSDYASLRQCSYEVARAEALFRSEGIPYVNTTTMSIEEIATKIIHEAKLERRLY
ncbi:posphoenolpyruvate synthetase regulatory kinase/phosphorylase PpsR [Alkalilimnicola ehrlichii]|uniref:posphoenolpyruvate synthetase regulatory kinase/phosphorylase PpsR n=1 Tax=Alkalilimnicola ehrlichii TaxID=351052 RepID=UPI003BA08C9A